MDNIKVVTTTFITTTTTILIIIVVTIMTLIIIVIIIIFTILKHRWKPVDEWQGLNGKCIVHRKSDLWHTYIFCEYAGMIFLCLKHSVYIIAQSSSFQQSSETRTIHESKDWGHSKGSRWHHSYDRKWRTKEPLDDSE